MAARAISPSCASRKTGSLVVVEAALLVCPLLELLNEVELLLLLLLLLLHPPLLLLLQLLLLLVLLLVVDVVVVILVVGSVRRVALTKPG